MAACPPGLFPAAMAAMDPLEAKYLVRMGILSRTPSTHFTTCSRPYLLVQEKEERLLISWRDVGEDHYSATRWA